VVEEAAHLLAFGCGVGIAGQEVGALMEGGFAGGEEANQSPRQKVKEGQSERLEFFGDPVGRISDVNPSVRTLRSLP
jgi:hypothetical protein